MSANINSERSKRTKTSFRESIVNMSRIPQPDTFADLIGGKYTINHIEEKREQDRNNLIQ